MAVLYHEYLVQMDRVMAKDSHGYFNLTAAKIEKTIGLSRHVQDKARQLLVTKKWLRCKRGGGESPAIRFKVLEGKYG